MAPGLKNIALALFIFASASRGVRGSSPISGAPGA